MKRLLIYYNFIVVSLMVTIGFLSAKNFSELLVASLFYPLFVFFGIKVFPRANRAVILPAALPKPVKKKGKEPKEIAVLKKEGVDIDRRLFLKLIGSAGFSVFLFSLFTKKAEAAFFGSVPGPGTVSLKDSTGVKIDPAVKHPTDGYKITELDDSVPSYYGFIDKDGNWFVMKEDSTGAYRYTKGSSSFSTNWTNRASLTYDYFDNVF